MSAYARNIITFEIAAVCDSCYNMKYLDFSKHVYRKRILVKIFTVYLFMSLHLHMLKFEN